MSLFHWKLSQTIKMTKLMTIKGMIVFVLEYKWSRLTIAYHKFSSSLGIIFVDCDDDERNVSQFTSLFLCPDPILLDSCRGIFDILRRWHKFGNSDPWRLRVKRAPFLAPPTLFIGGDTPSASLCPLWCQPLYMHCIIWRRPSQNVTQCITWMFFHK